MASTTRRSVGIFINGKAAAGSIKALTSEKRKLVNQLNLMVVGSEEYKKTMAKIKALDIPIKKHRQELRGVQQSWNKVGGSASTMLKSISTQAVAALGAIGLAGLAYEAGQAVADTVVEVNQLRKEIAQLTNASGGELDSITVKVRAIGAAFDQGPNELLRAGNALVKEFGIEYGRAFDLIAEGNIRGADASGDFLDNIREYSTQFREAGFSAGEFIDISVRAQQEGIFSDKGLDVVKEFNLRIREQTTATTEAMQAAFGKKATEEIFGGINDGSLTTAQALKRVAREMTQTEIPANRLQTVIADVFGGPGEDAGLRFIQLFGETKEAFAEVSEEAQAYIDAQREILEANKDLAFEENELAKSLFELDNGFNVVWTNIKGIGLRVLNSLIEFFQKIPATVAGVRAAINQAFSNLNPFDEGEAKSAMQAYRETYLREVKVINQQREAAEREFEKQQLQQQEEAAVQLAQRRAEATKRMEAERLKALAESQKREALELENQLINKEISEREYQNRLYEIEKQGLIDRLELFRQFGTQRSLAALEAQNQLDEIRQAELEREKLRQQGELEQLQTIGLQKVDVATAVAEAEKRALESVLEYAREINQEAVNDYREKQADKLKAEKALQAQQAQIMTDSLATLGTLTGEYFAGQKDQQAQFLKDILVTLLSALQKAVIANIAGATAIEASTKPFPANVFTTGIKVAAINTAFAAAKVAVNSFSQRKKGGFFDVRGKDDGKKYNVLPIGQPTTGLLDYTHPVLVGGNGRNAVIANENGREYYVSHPDLQRPAIADHVRAIENLKRYPQFNEGGFNETGRNASPPETVSQPPPEGSRTTAVLERTELLLQILIEEGVFVRLDDNSLIAIQNRLNDIDAASGGRAFD